MTKRCSCCDSTEHLQAGHGSGGLNDVCKPCFAIWYDCGVQCTRENCCGGLSIHGEDIREYNIKAKAEGRYPFHPDGPFAVGERP